MADVKISALTAAASAAGANELPINEAGTSKKLTITQLLTFMEANIDALTSAGNITFTLGDALGANEVTIKDSGGASVISLDSDGNITGVTYGGITEANLLDKSATETVSGAWNYTNTLTCGTVDTMTVNGVAVTSALAINTNTNTIFEIHGHSNTETPLSYFARSRGTSGAHTIVANGDNLGIIYAAGYDGADFALGAAISFVVNGTPGLDDMPTKITFGVSSDGGQAPVTKLTVQEAGVDLVASTTLSIAGTAIIADSSGTATLSNIDALDATTESTIEAAIDTLANLTSATALASIGTITTGTWTGTTIAVANGGTGQTTYTDGQLLIGNTTGNTLTKATLTGTANKLTVTNGGGSITLTLPATVDLSSNTSVAIPSAAGGTTLDAAGEICIDSTSKTVNFYNGTAETVLQPELSKAITIESPTSTEDFSIFFTDYAITVTKIVAVLVGSATPSVTWTVRHGTDRSAAGAEVVTSGTTTTSTTSGSVVTTFNDATIVADSFIWLETTAKSGTVNSINITILYTQDP